MMDVGTRVRVIDGEHHGKTGTISRVAMHTGQDSLSVRPVVALDNGTEIEIGGQSLTPIRR